MEPVLIWSPWYLWVLQLITKSASFSQGDEIVVGVCYLGYFDGEKKIDSLGKGFIMKIPQLMWFDLCSSFWLPVSAPSGDPFVPDFNDWRAVFFFWDFALCFIFAFVGFGSPTLLYSFARFYPKFVWRWSRIWHTFQVIFLKAKLTCFFLLDLHLVIEFL